MQSIQSGNNASMQPIQSNDHTTYTIGQPCILTASPRIGNSSFAASIIQDTWKQGQIFSVAQMGINPCISCGYCASHKGQCYFDSKDSAQLLFNALSTAPYSCIISPIYYYHIPAQFKAFMDRSQAWYEHSPAKHSKKLALILLAGRANGEQLFAGAMLSFKYMAKSLGMELLDPLLLYALDTVDALKSNLSAQSSIQEYAKKIQNSTSLKDIEP